MKAFFDMAQGDTLEITLGQNKYEVYIEDDPLTMTHPLLRLREIQEDKPPQCEDCKDKIKELAGEK